MLSLVHAENGNCSRLNWRLFSRQLATVVAEKWRLDLLLYSR